MQMSVKGGGLLGGRGHANIHGGMWAGLCKVRRVGGRGVGGGAKAWGRGYANRRDGLRWGVKGLEMGLEMGPRERREGLQA